jgi:tRNA A-37 threonylcarbamoyl transferase component Bud32
MATRVTLTPAINDSDPVLVSKVKLTNDRGDREAEANWLERAARPGIVRVVSVSADPFTIVTEHAGSRTLRTAGLDPDAALGVLIAVATTLAELHRDGLVHGKLTVDHIILGANDTWLCSPDGNADDASLDLDSIARCMRELARQWDASGTRAAWRDQWDDIAGRLERADDPSRSATRTVQALRRLLSPDADQPAGQVGEQLNWRSMFRSRGIAAVATAVVAAFAGLALISNESPAEPGGPRITVDGATYAVGSEGNDVALLDSPCDPSAPVLVLDRDSATVWAFSSVGDGVRASPVAVVPGATDLRSERIEGRCDVAVARGPAGVVVIDVDRN